MSDINPNQRIYDVAQAIHQGRYRIPNIQRGYEWRPERVSKLLDSIMSGYPIGAIMVWQPTDEIRREIRTRRFAADFVSTQDYLTDAPIQPTRCRSRSSSWMGSSGSSLCT